MVRMDGLANPANASAGSNTPESTSIPMPPAITRSLPMRPRTNANSVTPTLTIARIPGV